MKQNVKIQNQIIAPNSVIQTLGGSMRSLLRSTLIGLLGVFVVGLGAVWATTPSTVRIEVKISDPNTGLLNGIAPVVVRLYESSSSSTAVWTESKSAVNFSNGVFSMELGTTTPFTSDVVSLASAVFGITVDNNPEFYIPVNSVPYSLKSKWADEVLTFNWASANVTNTPNVSVFPGTLTGIQVPDELITSRMVGAGAISDIHITGPISAGKIAGSISSSNLGSGVISGTNIADSTITNTNLATGSFSNIVGLGSLTSTLNINSGSGILIPSRFQVDGFTGQVGINLTDAPTAYLDVNGAVRFRDSLRVSGDVYLPADLSVVSDNTRVLTVSNGIIRQVDVSTWDRNSANDVTSFTGLSDVPSTYSGSATHLLRVNAAGTGLEFIPSLTVGDASSLGGTLPSGYVRTASSAVFSGGIFDVASGSTLNIQTGAGVNVEGSLLISGQPLGSVAFLNTVGESQLAANSVVASKILTSAVTTSKISDLAITEAKLADNSVTTVKIANDAITTDKILAGAITSDKLAAGAVSASSLGSGSIDATKLASDAVTGAKILDGAVSNSKLAAGSYTNITGVGTLGSLSVTNGLSAGSGVYTGTVTAGSFEGVGSGLTALNASNLSSGTIANTLVSGAYPEITAVGVLTELTVQGMINSGDIDAGAISGTSISGTSIAVNSGAFSVATGTSPFTVTSTTKVDNLNVDRLNGLDSTAFLQRSNNLSDVASATTARSNLGLGDLAVRDTVGDAQITDVASGKVTGLGDLALLDTVNTNQIDNGAVTLDKLANVTAGQVIVGNASNRPTAVALSGDATLSNAGLLTIGTGAVTSAKILDGTIAAADLASNAVTTVKIANSAVTAAKLGSDVFANITAVTTNTLAVSGTTTLAGTASTGFTISNAGRVSYPYRNAEVDIASDAFLGDTFVFTPGSENTSNPSFRFKSNVIVDSTLYLGNDRILTDGAYAFNQPEPLYIGFTGKDNQVIGSLSGQNGGDTLNGIQGVKLESAGADYAEYLSHLNANETINKGDVVGVFAGKITRNTVGADRVMVVSTMPIVLGNWKPSSNVPVSPVAFVGQVPVRVKGAVKTGDYIVSSGLGDGLAVAKSAAEMSFEDIAQTVGQAWESNSNTDIKVINVALLPDGVSKAVIASLSKENRSLRVEMDQMRKDIDAIKASLKK